MTRILTICLFVFLALTAQGAAADSLRCGQALITRNDSKYEVLKKCGEPDYREVVSGELQDKEEVWIYDFGPQRFQYVITFKGFRIFRIESEPSPPRTPDFGKRSMRCGQKIVLLGMNKLNVIQRCGEPILKDVVSGGGFQKREVWSYDFGSNRFV